MTFKLVSRLILLVPLCTLVWSPSLLAKSLYKCVNESKQITYQATPCAAASEQKNIRIDAAPTRADVDRALAREASKQIELTSSPIKQRTETRHNNNKDCNDIAVYNYNTFSEEHVEGGRVTDGIVVGGTSIGNGLVVGGQIIDGTYSGGEVITTRCATIEFQLKGYGGRINDDEYATDVASNMIAIFSNGQMRYGSSGRIDASSRIQLGKTYVGSFCFGSNDAEIIDIQCK